MKEWMGHVGAMLVVAVWGTTFVSSKLLIGYGLTPADIFFYRFLLAYVCMVAVSHRRMWSGSYSLLMRRVMLRYGAIFLTRKVFGYGVLTILPWFLLVHPLCTDTAILMRTPVLSNLLFLGLVASTGGFLVWNRVMKVLGAVRLTNYVYFQSLLTMAVGSVVLHERVTWMALLGCMVLIGGMLVALNSGKKAKAAQATT